MAVLAFPSHQSDELQRAIYCSQGQERVKLLLYEEKTLLLLVTYKTWRKSTASSNLFGL